MIKKPSRTHSQKQLTYQSDETNIYDENNTKAKLIKNSMPKRPLKSNNIESIKANLNEFNVNFLIMSHNGAKNYSDRLYKKEALIYLNKYININNRIIHSFIQERLDNSKLYKHHIKKQDYDKFLIRQKKFENFKTIFDSYFDGKDILLDNKDIEQYINEKNKKYMMYIQGYERLNDQLLEELKEIQNNDNIYDDKTKQINLNLESKKEDSIILVPNIIEEKIKMNNFQIKEYRKEIDKFNGDFKKILKEKYYYLKEEFKNLQLSDVQQQLFFKAQYPKSEHTIVFLCPIGMKSIDREQQYQKIIEIRRKIEYVKNLKNENSEDILNYIDYYRLYQDIKAKFKEEKSYTVNTLMCSNNPIYNSTISKECKYKLKFIQDMLKYMDENDVHKKIDNKKALTHRNVGHISFNLLCNKVRIEENNKKIKQSDKEQDYIENNAEYNENSSESYLQRSLSLKESKSQINSNKKLKIYSHYVDEKYSIKSQGMRIVQNYQSFL